MNLSHPAFDVFGENEGRILHRLAVLAEGASGRRIHSLAGVPSLRTTQRILEHFTRVGLVTMRSVGNSHEYSVNRGHVLWEPISRVLELAAVLETRITKILTEVFRDRLMGAALYGSFARGEASFDSDVDILIVVADNEPALELTDMIDEASRRIEALTGNEAQILPLSRSEIQNLVLHNDPLIASLRADARSLWEGFQLESILNRGSRQ